MVLYSSEEIYAFRLPPGVEIVAALTDYCSAHNIQQGLIQGMGAVHAPEIGSYDFDEQNYHYLELEGDWELVAFNANVSLKEGQPFIHPHVMLASPGGEVRGGHLLRAEVIVGEVAIQVLVGAPQERLVDPLTGLRLWPSEPPVVPE